MDGSGFRHEFPRRNRRRSMLWLIPSLFWFLVVILLAVSSPSPGSELPRAIAEFPTGH